MREWYFQAMGQELGPFSAAELKTKVDGGQIQADTMVRRGADGKWLFADRVKGLLPSRPEPSPPAVAPAGKSKSSATMSIVGDARSDGKPEAASSPSVAKSAASNRPHVIAIPLESDADQESDARGPSSEFYDFVGFREAISPVLHHAVRQYMIDHHLTMTQLNRRALAAFIARPELAGNLMITNMAVIPQQVNEKSNADRSHPLTERDRHEQATFRITLFNSSSLPLDVSQGGFLPESVEAVEYDETGTKVLPAIDHKGHVSVNLNGAQPGAAIPMTLKATVPALSATVVVVWFRGTNKPGLTKIRGQLRLGEGGNAALSEAFTIIMHSDSP
jgi:hypothetical protein